MNIWGYLSRDLPVLLRTSVSHLWSTDSSGSIEIPSFQTTEVMTSGYRTRPSQRTKSLRHSYPLGPTSSWQLPGSAFYSPPRRRTLSTLRRASPSAQPQLWIISSHSQGLTLQNISAALPRPRIPLLLADVFHYLLSSPTSPLHLFCPPVNKPFKETQLFSIEYFLHVGQVRSLKDDTFVSLYNRY
ncbi:hypothetical protein AMECASPLE_009341 [Ameca splendens]|uniref:Uncharacterized protein n=1 Tax=Ameca splendens TaxID=208324 RepID=A0ABV0XDA3_9TELE